MFEMDSVTSWVLLYLGTALVSLLFATYLYSIQVFKYFEKRGIPYEPSSFPFGNLTPVFTLKKSYNELLFNMYNKYKGEKFVGFFQFLKKSVLIIDRDLIKLVLVKDFEYFDDKNIHHNKDLEPLTAHLFALDGYEWKLLRTKMTPAFSSGKLKGMFETIVNVGHSLTDYITNLTLENDVIESKDLLIRYGLAIVASTAFGLESDVLTDKSSMFFKMSEVLTAPTLGCMYRNGLMFYGRDIARSLGLRIIPKDTHKFFMNLLNDVVQYRESRGKTRNDFLQLLIQLKHGATIEGKEFSITMNELAAQSYVFILAGFETSSNVMSFFLYEMALNPEVQRRVQEEVDAVENITYDNLAGMDYLDMAIDESLRKYPPLGFVGRVCSKDYQVPGTEQIIEKGTQVLVSTHSLHWDPDLFPEPEQFIPERFSKENKNNIKPFSYMPFGEGPRFCIGMRFGKLSVKAGLATLLKKYEVQTAPNTPMPLKFQAKTINTTAEGGMWLRFVNRQTSTS